MKNMAFSINHNIPIMSIFNLQNITNKTISSKRLTEIKPRLLKSFRPRASKLVSKIMNKPGISPPQFFLDATNGHTILNKLKYATPLPGANNLIRL